jgi:lauroyl/myristoyl acyltransferase
VVAYLLWRLATAIAPHLPLRFAYLCAGGLADLFFLAWREKRENTIDNMRHVLAPTSEAAARRVARESFRNYARYLVDFIRCPSMSPEELQPRVAEIDWPAIDSARAEGKGLIFALMHFGSWDLGGMIFSQRGYALNVVAETFKYDKLNRMVVNARTTSGMRVIPMERAALGSLRALRNNEALAVLMDRPGADHGVAVRFFGSPTVLPTGAARLALRTGARILPAGMARAERSSDRLITLLDTEFRFEPTGDNERDVVALMEALLAVHEGFIRRFPDQWYMFRRMWEPDSEQARRAPA